MAGCCNMSARVVLMLLGLVFWACAAGMIFLAVEIFDYIGPISSIYNNIYLAAPAGVLVGLSILLILVGLIGCLGACKESRCLQITFFTLLLVIVMMEITGAVLSIVYKDEVKDAIETGMSSAITKYNDEEKIQDGWDYMQKTFKCCGVDTYDDWFTTSWGKENVGYVPESCCKKSADGCSGKAILSADLDKIYQDGCHTVVYNDVKMYLAWIIAIAIIFVLVQMTGLICTCVRLWSKRKEQPYEVLGNKKPDTSGYRA